MKNNISRREFLKGAGASAASLALMSLLPGSVFAEGGAETEVGQKRRSMLLTGKSTVWTAL